MPIIDEKESLLQFIVEGKTHINAVDIHLLS